MHPETAAQDCLHSLPPLPLSLALPSLLSISFPPPLAFSSLLPFLCSPSIPSSASPLPAFPFPYSHLHHFDYHRLHLLILAQYFILNTQDLALQQILSSIDLFVSYTGLITRTLGPSNNFTLLNGWICQCVRLIRLLVSFRTHFKSLHFHSFIHSIHLFFPSKSS